MLRRKPRQTEFPTTDRRSHRAGRTAYHDPAQRRRAALLRAAARQVDW